MKLVTSIVAMGAGLLLSGAACAAGMTEADINHVLGQLDQASNSKNVDGVLKHMAPQVRIQIDMSAVGMQQPMVMSRAEYASSLRDNWGQAMNYRYQRSNTKIRIAADGQSAQATASVKESMKIQGQPISSVTDETTKFELIKGQPMATEVRGVVRSVN